MLTELQSTSQAAPVSSPDPKTGMVNEAAVTPDPNVAGKQGGVPDITPNAEKRINDLIGKLKGESEARRALELEMAELRGRVSQGEQSSDPWSKIADEQLLEIAAQEKSSPEQKAEALRRYHQRVNAKIEALSSTTKANVQFQEQMAQAWETIRAEHGAEVDNKTSPLYQKALEVFSGYRQKLGAKVVDSDPTFQIRAFEVANSLISSGTNSEIAALKAENARLKQNSTIEAAGNMASAGMSQQNKNVRGADARATAIEIAKRMLSAPPIQ